jgi:hypothetical protein
MLPKLAAKSTEARKRIRLSAAAAGIGVSALLVSGCGYFETKEGSWELEVACSDEDQKPAASAVHPNMYALFSCIDAQGISSRPESIRIARETLDGDTRSFSSFLQPNVVVHFTYGAGILPDYPSGRVVQVDADGDPIEKPGLSVRDAHIDTIAEIDRDTQG